MASLLRSSKFVKYFVGFARGVSTHNRYNIDQSLLQRNLHFVGSFYCNFATGQTNLRFSYNLDKALRQLDDGARRTGRISMKEIEEALNDIRSKRKVTSAQSLMLLRSCGNLVPEESPEKRTQLVDQIWKALEQLGIPLDISHYNALLKVYLENEHKFSPTELLAMLEKQGVQPNRVTYQRLIAGYCQMGDISGATKILEFMKEKELPVSEGVFNALILGHSQADDMESAEGILGVMQQANLEPSNETYCTLMCGYARRGDTAAINRLITECKVKDVLLSDRDTLEIAYTAAVHDHNQLVDEILKNIRNLVGYNQEAANVLLRMLTRGKYDSAYKVFETMTPPIRSDNIPNMSGHFIIKQMVKTNRKVEEITALCNKLESDGHTKYGLFIALETSFHHGNIDLTLGLLRSLRDKQEPVRCHYFWPSMHTLGKAGQPERILDLLDKMISEFDLIPNHETLTPHYLPFVKDNSNTEVARKLMEIGVTRRQVVLSVLYHLLEQSKIGDALNFAELNLGVNLRSAILGKLLLESLHKSDDVKSAVALLHMMSTSQKQDQEEDEESVEDITGRFLSGVASFAHTRKKITLVLEEMVAHGLGISNTCAELVENRLSGTQMTADISDLLAKLSSGELAPVASKRMSSMVLPPIRNTAMLERAKARAKDNNHQEVYINMVRNLFQAYCEQGDLENVLKIKQEYEEELKQELTPGWWAKLLDLYCSKGDLEESKLCLQRMKDLIPETEVDSAKILKLAKLYVQNNQIDEAIKLLKDIKWRKEGTYEARAACWQLLDAAAETTKDPVLVNKLLNILVEERQCEVTNILLGPIIKAYLARDDVVGALKEFEGFVKKYRATPFKNELTIRLIENEDASNLQTLVDLSTEVHGEVNSLYDLVLSFVECGRIRQARKILETPGLNVKPSRLHFACERYRKGGLVAPLEGLVEATKDLPHIDRSEIYNNLLETYCQSDNVEKAFGLWTQMQDEDVNVTDEFLIRLGNFMKGKGFDVPFEIPEDITPTDKDYGSENTRQTKLISTGNLMSAIGASDVKQALKIKERLERNGMQLTQLEVTRLLHLLVEKKHFTDAVNLMSNLKDNFPSVRSIKYLISRLANAGELDMLTKVGYCLSEELKKSTYYVNEYMRCAVVAGEARQILNDMEKAIDAATTPDEIDTLAHNFPRGGILAVLDSSPSNHEQVVSITEKYFKKGCTAPANSLCLFYLTSGQVEKAKELYQRYNLANLSQIMFRPVLRRAKIDNDPKVIEDTISLFQNCAALTPQLKAILYSNLINIHLDTNNHETALSKFEEGLKLIPLEEFYYSTLTKLKDALESKNIPFNHTIPDKRQIDASSSSSSSDAEMKQSVAAKH